MTLKTIDICLSLQRALLDAVTPALRRVCFEQINKIINLYFYYEGTPSEIENELVVDVSAEVISDFPGEYDIRWEIIPTTSDEKIQSRGQIIFSRYEKKQSNEPVAKLDSLNDFFKSV